MPLPSVTWQDVQQMPDDGNRYEAIEGDLYMTPAPTFRHQRVSLRLGIELNRMLEEPGHGVVVGVPVGVEFPATGEGVQPDLLFVSNERRGIITQAGLTGAPDLAVEILSPTTVGARPRPQAPPLRTAGREGVLDRRPGRERRRRVAVRKRARTRAFHGRLYRLGSKRKKSASIDLESVFASDLLGFLPAPPPGSFFADQPGRFDTEIGRRGAKPGARETPTAPPRARWRRAPPRGS